MDVYLQDRRLLRIDTVLGADHVLLVGVDGTDRISTLYAYDLELVSTDPDLTADQLLGSAARIYICPEGAEQPISVDGIISRFTVMGRESRGLRLYRARLVPMMWLLTRSSDCRIFQDQDVRSIVDTVLADFGVQRREWKLSGHHGQHEFCVQYRETAYDFVCRLLEEEGISFYFRQDDSGHTLVMCDSNHGFGQCVDANVPLRATDHVLGGVTQWERSYRVRSGQWALQDYNFETPSTDLVTQRKTVNPVLAKRALEMYDYPGRYEQRDNGNTIAQWRIEYEEAAYEGVAGESSCPGFAAGTCFNLSNAANDQDAQQFLLIEVHHTAEDWNLLTHDGKSSYANTFRCAPQAVPYRPPMRTPRPRIHGAQTAVVTGPSGAEIFTDKYGRIKVQFPWDRYGKKNDHSSCFIRVAQTWAGRSFGGWFLPRIGQEVVVTFLEGDPDRPLVVGSVYNAEQTVPFPLPANATQSGLRTRSSMAGSAANCNEFRFEDKKGSEEVLFHAEKDLTKEVEHDASHWVGHDETTTVDHDRTEHVKNNETITIDNNRTETVHGNETITIGVNRTETVQANETVTIGKNRSHTVALNETLTVGVARVHSVGAAEAINVGAARTVTVGAIQSISVGSNQSISVGGNESTQISKDRTTSVGQSDSLDVGKSLTITAGDEIVLKTGSATITMKKNGDITIEGKQITIKGSGDVVIKGQKILQN
ncbi:MAG TPA: type VI secretion system tip protein TssI/VgrG [Acetobacteraceae bacterium]|nr:type VI secretion system tip protein TssI/VgrG [Acetobacteraceae bacterium]